VTDHEHLFLLTKRPSYYYDHVAVMVPVSSNTHSRGHGVNPKARAAGKNSRMTSSRDPEHDNRAVRSRQNESFAAAVRWPVERRNLRTVWRMPVASYKGAHFATFPKGLVEPCVLAGSSNHGCCDICGAPWVRQTSSERVATRPGLNTKIRVPFGWQTGSGVPHDSVSHQASQLHPKIVGNRDPERHITTTVTTGWAASCRCGSGVIPATVLDPFLGSGTTAIVAMEHGRKWVGCERKEDYAAQAQIRIDAEAANGRQLVMFE
jgi:hypothetical protein